MILDHNCLARDPPCFPQKNLRIVGVVQDVYKHHHIKGGAFIGDPLAVESGNRNQCPLSNQDVDSFQSHIWAEFRDFESDVAVSATHVQNPRTCGEQLRNCLCESASPAWENETAMYCV